MLKILEKIKNLCSGTYIFKLKKKEEPKPPEGKPKAQEKPEEGK